MEKSLLRIFDETLFALVKMKLISTDDREYLDNLLKIRMDKFEEDKTEE